MPTAPLAPEAPPRGRDAVLGGLTLSTLTDDELLAEQTVVAAERHRLDARLAAIVAEIARRSDPMLGLSGLAQRLGARTPQKLIQSAGFTAREAGELLRVGTALTAAGTGSGTNAGAGTGTLSEALTVPIAAGLTAGTLSLAAADAITSGFGTATVPPEGTVGDPAGELAIAAVMSLVETAGRLTPDRLAAEARFLRAELDETYVADRELALREQRFLRLSSQADGMTRLSGLLDPESAAIIRAAYDSATSPRRGGPRFVDPDQRQAAAALDDDPRSTEQLALDALVDLVRIGAEAEPGLILGAGRHAVRVHVTDHDLHRRAGYGLIEGETVAVSIATIDRQICDTGAVPIHFDSNGQVVNVGREQRLFTIRQRIGLAARDGGCRWDDCDRPPSWCEAHHIDHWARDGGRTDVADGILLCRHHHHLVHAQGWEIHRTDGQYHLIPPPGFAESRPMPVKTALARRRP